jgi:hypothetical protein
MTSATASSARGAQLALSLGALLACGSARAEPPDAAAMAREGHELLQAGRLTEACPKLAESVRLVPAPDTTIELADCHEKRGLVATAWTTFQDAAFAAQTAGKVELAQQARARAAALLPRLTRLTVTLAPGAYVTGLQVNGDGRPFPRSLIGAPVPLDPGDHTVSASAPGRQPWSVVVHVDAVHGGSQSVVVPLLPDPTGRLQPGTSGVPQMGLEASPTRKAGYALIGIGLATSAIGGILGTVALLKKSSDGPGCRANQLCIPSAASDLDTAITLANASTGTLVAGSAVFVAGIVLVAATRTPEDDRIASAPLRVAPVLGPGLAGLAARGSF